MNGFISEETYSDYLQCLNEDLKKELVFNGLEVITKDELAAIKDELAAKTKTDTILNKVTLYKDDLLVGRKVIIRLTYNSNALIGITCLSEPKNITSQFIFCDDDDDCKRAAEARGSKDKTRVYGQYGNIFLRMTNIPSDEFGDILNKVGQTISAITDAQQNAGGKKRKAKPRKAKSRKSKPRKAKSRKK